MSVVKVSYTITNLNMQQFIYIKKLYARDLTKEAIEAGKIFKHCSLLSLVSNGHVILGLNSLYADVRKNKQCLEWNITDYRCPGQTLI
jgi:hypothetical protein